MWLIDWVMFSSRISIVWAMWEASDTNMVQAPWYYCYWSPKTADDLWYEPYTRYCWSMQKVKMSTYLQPDKLESFSRHLFSSRKRVKSVIRRARAFPSVGVLFVCNAELPIPWCCFNRKKRHASRICYISPRDYFSKYDVYPMTSVEIVQSPNTKWFSFPCAMG